MMFLQEVSVHGCTYSSRGLEYALAGARVVANDMDVGLRHVSIRDGPKRTTEGTDTELSQTYVQVS